jgi:hypothetical protein
MKYIIYEGWSDIFDCDSRYYERELTSQAMGLIDLYNTLNEVHKIRPFKDFNIKSATKLKEELDYFGEVRLTFKDEEDDTYHTVLTIIKIGK